MKQVIEFIKATIVGEFFVILPIFLVFLVISEMISVSLDLLDPLIEQLPDETIISLWIARILVIFNILFLCLVTGLLIRMKFGKYLKGSMEKLLLNRLPGYTIIKSLTHRFSGSVDGMDFAPALVDLLDTGVQYFGLIMDEFDDDHLTVFIPLAPTPTLGQVCIVPRERVKKSDAPLGDVMNCIMRWGIQSNALTMQKG